MKKKILLMASVAVFVLLLVACASGIDSIMFEKQPKTTYVQGQEIDFTDTVLVAMKGDKKENVDLTAGDVTITGYDKNQVGKQTVTFTYKEVSTTLTVTVVPRITIEGVVTDYFVGDGVNRTEGRIRVADDNAKTSTVNFDSDLITTEGFDSSTAGEKTVTVKYGGYTATYTANVYEVEKVELSKRPQQTLYDSHDTEFVFTGAYFTVTANGGALSRYVTLTEDNIKDFDPSLATVENISERKEMTVKIHYLGYEFDYKIYVLYSAVSYMNDVAKKLEDISNPKLCDAATADEAIAALTGYYSLSGQEKRLIDKDDTEKIALVVAYHGLKKLDKLVEKYSEAFDLVKRESMTEEQEDEYGKYYGIFNIKAENYKAASDAVKSLKGDEGKQLNELAATLRSIEEEFPKLKIDGKNMDEYLGHVFTSDVDVVVGIFSVMVEVYDELSEEVIPADWTPESLVDYKANIKKAVIAISDSEYNPFASESYLEMFKMLSKWRANDDIYDIISSYYLTHEPDSFVDAIWEKVPLPGRLNDLYLLIRYAISVTNSLRIGSDTTPFMYYYTKAIELSEEIKNGDDAVEKDVHKNIGFDNLIRAYGYTAERVNNIGYAYHASGLVGNEKVENLLDKYIALVSKAYTEVDFSFATEENIAESKSMLADFMALSPAERYGFIAMIHCDYRGNMLDDSIFACLYEDGVINTYNLFARFILNAYNETLSKESFDVFTKLFVATEHASLYTFQVDGKDNFMDEMEEITPDLDKLSASDRQILLDTFDDVFDIYNELKSPKNPDISDHQDKVDELLELIDRFFEINAYLGENADVQVNGSTFALLFANYEKARAVANEILLLDDPNLRYHYHHTIYTFDTDRDDDDDEDNDFSSTLDCILEEMATIRTRTLLFANVTIQHKEIEEGESEDDYMAEINAFYVYEVSKIAEFLVDAYDVMWAQFKGTASELDAELVISVMKKKLELSGDGLLAFKTLNADVLYYDGVRAALAEALSSELYELVEKLLVADDAHAGYVTEDLERTLEAYKNAVEALQPAYDEFADKDSFESFKEIYDYIISEYEQAIAPDEDVETDEGGTTEEE